MTASGLVVAFSRTGLTLALGALGGWLAMIAGLPLPWMLGPLIAVTGVAVGGLSLGGHTVDVPRWLRNVMIPVIGVMVGASFTPEIAGRMVSWWPTLLALFAFIGIGTFAVYQLYRRVFGFDPVTAYFSSVPGGLIDMALIGEQLGGSAARISLIHFCRIVLAAGSMPFIVGFIHGPSDAVSAGAASTATLGLEDVLLLIAAGVGGFYGARLLRLPGAVIVGPLAASAAVHACGLTDAAPPAFLVTAAQVAVGSSLGSQFAVLSPAELGRALRASLAAAITLTTVTMLVSAAMYTVADQPFAALVLAYAPGGFAEMSLIALSVDIGVAFVAAHHVVRIALSVLVMPLVWKLVVAPRVEQREAG